MYFEETFLADIELRNYTKKNQLSTYKSICFYIFYAVCLKKSCLKFLIAHLNVESGDDEWAENKFRTFHEFSNQIVLRKKGNSNLL